MPKPVSILFLGRSIGHFSYLETTIAGLLRRGASVELLFDKAWSRDRSGADSKSVQEFKESYPELATGWALRRADGWRDFLFSVRELRSYRSYLVRRRTTPYYLRRWSKYLTPGWKQLIRKKWLRSLLKTPMADWTLRFLEWLAPCDPDILAFLSAKNPDVLVASPANMRFSEETDFLKASRHLGVPTAIQVLSWDNLSTKGLIQAAPQRLFVWNDLQYRDAREIHHIPPHRLSIAGSPFFDKWFDKPTDTSSREKFCRQLGLDPKRRILLYLGSSRNIATDETWFVEEVANSLETSNDVRIRDFQILVRPHPANTKNYRRLSEMGLCVWPKDGALPETRQDFAEMRDSFSHADAALGINTSGMIDAVLGGLPTFSVRLPKYAETQSSSEHFQHLERFGVLYLCEDVPALLGTLASVVAGHDCKADTRREFSTRFARPRGRERSAGDVIAEEILDLAAGGS